MSYFSGRYDIQNLGGVTISPPSFSYHGLHSLPAPSQSPFSSPASAPAAPNAAGSHTRVLSSSPATADTLAWPPRRGLKRHVATASGDDVTAEGAADGAAAGAAVPNGTVKRIARLALVDGIGGGGGGVGRGGTMAAPLPFAVTSSALARAEERRARRASSLARRACGEDGTPASSSGGTFALSDFNAVPVSISSNFDLEKEDGASDVDSNSGDAESESDSEYYRGRGHDDDEDDGGVGGVGGGGGGSDRDNDAVACGGGRRAGPKMRRLGHHARSVRFAAVVAPHRSPTENGESLASAAGRPRSPPPPSAFFPCDAPGGCDGMSSGVDSDASDGSGEGWSAAAANLQPTPCFRCRVAHYPGMAISRSGLECSCGRGVAPRARPAGAPVVVIEPSAACVLEASRAPPPLHRLPAFHTSAAPTITPPELAIVPYVSAPWKLRFFSEILRGQTHEQDESMRGADDDADGDDPGLAVLLSGRANGDPDAPSAIAGLGGALSPPSMLLG